MDRKIDDGWIDRLIKLHGLIRKSVRELAFKRTPSKI